MLQFGDRTNGSIPFLIGVSFMSFVSAKNLIARFYEVSEEGKQQLVATPINDLSIDINQGDFVAILGHNGSGKSTFAKHLNALLLPSEGTVFIDGKDTKDETKLWDIRQDVGLVFQNPDNQIIGATVEEDVAFGPENIGVPTTGIHERVNEALDTVDMQKYRFRDPKDLSGGQKQRVAIAGIMAMRTKCIVMDEPTAMLDPVGRRDVINMAHKLNKERGVTVILITHYMEEVIDADKLFIMDRGNLVMQGTPREIFCQVDKMKELRLDVPQATEVAYKLKKKGYKIRTDILTMDELADEIKAIRG